MMNSTADEGFPANPFRSNTPGTGDLVPQQTQQPTQQQPSFAQPPQQQQPSFAQPPPQQQQFLPVDAGSMMQPPHKPSPYAGQMDNRMGAGGMENGMATNAPRGGGNSESWYGACVSCFEIETYRAYFDIDTIDVQTRIVAALMMFHLPDHFRGQVVGVVKTSELKGPDLYGPLWITFTLTFVIAVTSNLSAYLYYRNSVEDAAEEDDIEEFEYDIGHLVNGSTMLLTFVYGVPTAFWLATRCMSMNALHLVEWICFYGYSMAPYVIAATFCVVPNFVWNWIFLMIATGASCLLVLRNVANPLLAADPTHQKAPPLVLAILVSHLCFMVILKLTHYSHN